MHVGKNVRSGQNMPAGKIFPYGKAKYARKQKMPSAGKICKSKIESLTGQTYPFYWY